MINHGIKELTGNSITSVSQPKEKDERDKKTVSSDGCHLGNALARNFRPFDFPGLLVFPVFLRLKLNR